MVLITIEVASLALLSVFTYLSWRFIFKVYLKKMKMYIPDLIRRLKQKDKIDANLAVVNLVWTLCNAYLVSRIVIMYVDYIVMLIKTVMEVIR